MATKRKTGEVIAFPQRADRLRADVPPFDPMNPAHLRAWESVYDLGVAFKRGRL